MCRRPGHRRKRGGRSRSAAPRRRRRRFEHETVGKERGVECGKGLVGIVATALRARLRPARASPRSPPRSGQAKLRPAASPWLIMQAKSSHRQDQSSAGRGETDLAQQRSRGVGRRRMRGPGRQQRRLFERAQIEIAPGFAATAGKTLFAKAGQRTLPLLHQPAGLLAALADAIEVRPRLRLDREIDDGANVSHPSFRDRPRGEARNPCTRSAPTL